MSPGASMQISGGFSVVHVTPSFTVLSVPCRLQLNWGSLPSPRLCPPSLDRRHPSASKSRAAVAWCLTAFASCTLPGRVLPSTWLWRERWPRLSVSFPARVVAQLSNFNAGQSVLSPGGRSAVAVPGGDPEEVGC